MNKYLEIKVIYMKQAVFLFLIVLYSMAGLTQKLRLNTYGAYVFDDYYDSYYSNATYYNGKVNAGFQWGIGTEFMIRPQYSVELMYLRRTTLSTTSYQLVPGNTTKTADLDLALNYLFLGMDGHYMHPRGRVELYGGLSGGSVFADIQNHGNGSDSSVARFVWAARLGCNIFSRGKVGIKIQGQLLSTLQTLGGQIYFGTYGPLLGLASYSSLYQFSLGGGLILKLGK